MGPIFKEKHPKLAEFIENKLPAAGNIVGNLLPDKGGLGILKNLITSSPDLSSEDKNTALSMIVEAEKMSNDNTADARKANIEIQTSDKVPTIVKLRPTIIAFIVTIVWAAMTVYIIGSMLNIIKRDITTNFEAIMAMYAGLNILFGNILNFDFGSSAGSQNKQKSLDKLMEKS